MATKYPLKEARLAAGRSLVKVAAESDCAIGTVRMYELDRDAVSPEKRRALDAVYAKFPTVGEAA